MNKGIKLRLNNNELTINGNKEDLIELASYITEIANSINKNDHLHLDNLTIINENSDITNLIIEKEEIE